MLRLQTTHQLKLGLGLIQKRSGRGPAKVLLGHLAHLCINLAHDNLEGKQCAWRRRVGREERATSAAALAWQRKKCSEAALPPKSRAGKESAGTWLSRTLVVNPLSARLPAPLSESQKVNRIDSSLPMPQGWAHVAPTPLPPAPTSAAHTRTHTHTQAQDTPPRTFSTPLWRHTSRATPPSPPPTISTFLGLGCAKTGRCAIISW